MRQSLFSRLGILLLSFSPLLAGAQTLHQEVTERVEAEVIEIVAEYERDITGTDAVATVQEVRVELLSGEKAGQVVRFENELVNLEAGDKIFVNRLTTIGGEEYISYADFERRGTLVILTFLFIVLLLVFSGWQGVRALLSLLGSIAAILFLLVPALLAGWNPVLSSVGIAGVVLAAVLFGTHGVNPRSVIAFLGTICAVVVTGVMAIVATNVMKLTGFSSDASVYLNFATNGTLDLSGLLLGSIIIGILGVLDDVSITQASVVQELKAANCCLKFKDLYQRAIKVGKDHIGSLVNTLALAYVGVALPLILLYAKAETSWWQTINQEIIAAELLRIIVGSIGLILAVPATTAVAAWWFNNREVDKDEVSSHHGHHHH
ncbi:YibE/F family protein [Candidatus Kaiserbacteria bacterium]|nr:YibE/F family protein [Candidatus Kaiserbacteria bacterium]